MSKTKRRKLDSAVAAIQRRHGRQALRRGNELPRQQLPPHTSTAFPQLDRITGCRGIPLNAITLLSGQTTSGKLTLAYKILASAQHSKDQMSAQDNVAILDLNQTADPDYLLRCGIDLNHLVVIRPVLSPEVTHLLLDLVAQRSVRMILVDSLADLNRVPRAVRALYTSLNKLVRLLRSSGCGLLFVDEPAPPWQRWLNLDPSQAVRNQAALHIELRREEWLTSGDQLVGYQATANVLKSRWSIARETPSQRDTAIAIKFNGTVKARQTW